MAKGGWSCRAPVVLEFTGGIAMRRLASTLGVLVAAATLAVAVPQSAFAANGDLILNGVVHHDPSGCFDSTRRPLFVDNRTDEYVYVFTGADCTGRVVEVVPPDERAVSEFGSSVYVR
ncbi:hypothetical protein [Streptomyces sp. NPDC048057]|uniref:hypothetical protein n=1 Tax=Streptomyces sp. NPDC048057 TaxID=3155628 RepID=UPI0033F90B51